MHGTSKFTNDLEMNATGISRLLTVQDSYLLPQNPAGPPRVPRRGEIAACGNACPPLRLLVSTHRHLRGCAGGRLTGRLDC